MMPQNRLAPPAALALVALIGLATSCAHKAEEPTPRKTEAAEATGAAPGWAGKMQSLSAALSDLLPLVASPAKFAAPGNQERIETNVKTIRALAHSLGGTAAPAPNADPAMAAVGTMFADDLDRALESLRSGNREYARAILKDVGNYCVSCHTQTNNGPSYGAGSGGAPRLALDFKANELPRMERADFYAATRQFDLALSEFKAVLDDPSASTTDAFAWERASRSALAIAVRVKKSPDAAISLVESMMKNKKAPSHIRKDAVAWLKSLKDWKREKPSSDSSAEARLAQGESLVARAQSGQKYPLDHSQDVVWFRAGGKLHDLLGESGLPAATAARALFLAGVEAEATRDLNFWTMHETYYESCIRKSPGSKQAERCFDRLNDSVTLGYSGSAGTMIPADVRKRLEALRALASSEIPSKPTEKP